MMVPEGTLAAAFPVAPAASPAAGPSAPGASPAIVPATAYDAATRPVPPEVIAAATAASAAPPVPPLDPRTMPAEAFGAHEPRSRAATEPPVTPAAAAPGSSSAPDRLDRTQALPPELLRDRGGAFDTRPVDASAVDAAASASRKGRRMGAISAVALLVVLMLGSGGAVLVSTGRLDSLLGTGQPLATAVPTNTAVSGPPTAPAGFQTYTASDGSYILNVPDGWATGSVPSASAPLTIFFDLHTNANFEINRVAQLEDPQSHDDLAIQQIAAALASKVNGSAAVSNKTGPTSLPLTNTLWTQEAADIAVTASGQTVTWHAVVLSIQHGQSTLLVAYFAPQAIFATTDAADFQPMLNSLRLVTPGP